MVVAVNGSTWVETRDIPIEALTRYPGNARRGNVSLIQESIRTLGQYRALVVREVEDGDLVILAGNHTRDALLAEGREVARCEVIRCDELTARKINLADNRISDLGTYDDQDISELLASLDNDYEGTGWSEADADLYLAAPPSLEELEDKYGEHVEGDLWPVLKFRVPPSAKQDFYDLTRDAEQDDDNVRFLYLLDCVRRM